MNDSNKILDVVNLNADASCLSSKWWLEILEGKDKSYLYNWLNNYVLLNKKVTLGITGATISDIYIHNNESIELINKNRNIFEICLRPFAHDIALLRSNEAFKINLEAGIQTIKKVFDTYTNYFLPPEFMLTNTQINILKDEGIQGTFIHPTRFNTEIQNRIPDTPYRVNGILNTKLNTIPFNGALTRAFLNGIHNFNANEWNKVNKEQDLNFVWRDGESAFFVPNGVHREFTWLKNEDQCLERVFLSDILDNISFDNEKENQFYSYPVHSFSAWVKEFKMIGFINKVQEIEHKLDQLTQRQKGIWLQLINSDILSSVEKRSPQIQIQRRAGDLSKEDYTIWRAERGLEGEELLYALEYDTMELSKYFKKKINGRIKFLLDEGIL